MALQNPDMSQRFALDTQPTTHPSGHPSGQPSAGKIACRPFLKWAGGKGQLVAELMARTPTFSGRYVEPFVGGGALFFALQPGQALLSDINEELINCYRVVKENVEDLIPELARHQHSRSYYYKIRGQDRGADYWIYSELQRASRLIFLNKCCYNGLYRVNSRGEFNVPFGDYSNPRILDEPNLRGCSLVLTVAELKCQSFQTTCLDAQAGDFVYLDPPYIPLSDTANFSDYSAEGFSLESHTQLRDCCRDLDRRGIKFMLSNSETDAVRELYADFHIESVQATRAINSKGSRRGKIGELVIRNYT